MSSFDLLRTFTTADLVHLAQSGSWAAGIVLKERRVLVPDARETEAQGYGAAMRSLPIPVLATDAYRRGYYRAQRDKKLGRREEVTEDE